VPLDKYSRTIVDLILYEKAGDLNNLKLEKLLVCASHNRVLYELAKKIIKIGNFPDDWETPLDAIICEGEKNIKALNNTLQVIEQICSENKIPYLIVKTYKFIEFITFDVDLLVHYNDFEKAIEAFEKNNFAIKPHPGKNTQGLHQRNLHKEGLLNIDLHRKFFWLGIEHLDEEYIWHNTQYQTIAGLKTPIPSFETDFLLNNKQLAYERNYITLLDFLAIKYAYEKVNWEEIKTKVSQFNWTIGFNILEKRLDNMHLEIFGNSLFGKAHKSKARKLPLFLNQMEATKIFCEILFKHKRFAVFEYLYFIFSKLRYNISDRIGYYDHWFDMKIWFPNKKYIYANPIIQGKKDKQ
jgi:hypothetical protein